MNETLSRIKISNNKLMNIVLASITNIHYCEVVAFGFARIDKSDFKTV